MIDFEEKRNQQLIEEREKYENEYFSQIKDLIGEIDEMDKCISEKYEYIFNPFDFEDRRNQQLIEEHEKYENEYFSQIKDLIDEIDDMDKYISERYEYIFNPFDFEPDFDYDCYEAWCDEIPMNGSYRDGVYEGYVISDDEFDLLDGIDYPETPERRFEDYMDFVDCPIGYLYDDMEEDASKYYRDLEKSHFKELVKQHLKEEEELEWEIEYYLDNFTEPEDEIDYSCEFKVIIEDDIWEYHEKQDEYFKSLIDMHINDENYPEEISSLE